MNLADALTQLEALGSEATRRTWSRHGAVGPMFGVKLGDLAKLKKRIGVDHALAKQLWETANHDARLLACMVGDSAKITERELDGWAAELADASTGDALAAFASRTAIVARTRVAWLSTPRLQRAGWSLVAHCARDGALLDEATALAYLQRIEAEIHQAENWTRRTMMYALIGIGGQSVTLRKAAEAVARRVGSVSFDPGETACEFPSPLPYLEKVWARKKDTR